MSSDVTSRTRPEAGPSDASRRSLPLAALLASLASAGIALVVCMAAGVIGWFLADAGAHGTTNDALRVGADGWLMGLGSHISLSGMSIAMAPLTVTALIVLAGVRCGRWAGRGSRPGEDERALIGGGVVAAGVYVVLAVVVVLLAQQPGARPGLTRAVLGALVLGGGSVTAGLALGSGHWQRVREKVPGFLVSAVRGGLAAMGLLVAAAAVLAAVALLGSFNQASELFSRLDLGVGDALMTCLVTALFAPNAVGLGVAFLLGPGFAFGTGTGVTAASVSLGPLPAFPVLAALPDPGALPGQMAALLAVPPLCAALGAGLAQHRYAVTSWDSAALRGFATGLAGALLTWVLVALSGGALGTGRMADVGAPLGEVLVTAVGGMSIGGLLGGLLVTLWQRRRA